MCHTCGTPASHAAGPDDTITPVFVWTSPMFSRCKISHTRSTESGMPSRKNGSFHERKTSRVMTLRPGKTITRVPVARTCAASGPSAGSMTNGSKRRRSSVRISRTSDRLAP